MKYEDILKEEDLKNFLGYWEKSKSYMKDNVIAYNGSLYKSLTDYNINNTPSVTPEHWDSLIKVAEKDVLFGYYDKDLGIFYADSSHTEELTAQVKKIYVDLTDDKFKEYMYSSTQTKYIALGGDKHFYFERVLKASDWDSTEKTQEIAIEQIVDNTLVTWNLCDDYTVDEYNACMDSGLKGKAEEGKIVFSVSEVPTKDIRVLIVVEEAEVEEAPEPVYDGPLKLTAVEPNSSVTLHAGRSLIGEGANMKYSTDGSTWNNYTFGTVVPLNSVGDFVMFKGDNASLFFFDDDGYFQFTMDGKISALGNCMSILDSTMELDTMPACGFIRLFSGCTSLTTPPSLPATTLAENCYSAMFENCTSLTTPPSLPVTTLAESCYTAMFWGCTSLTTPPSLPATTLAEGCYSTMFKNCTSLTTVPALPATTIADWCYNEMFSGCTKIKLSTSRTGEYVNEYRIPTEGVGVAESYSLLLMFFDTGGTFTGTPNINTTYYTPNEIV